MNSKVTGRRNHIDRVLYRSYARGHELREFISARISPIGFSVLSILVLGMCLSISDVRSVIYQVLSMSFGLCIFSAIFAYARRARVEAVRLLPQYATVGKTFMYQVEVKNLSSKDLKMAWLVEMPPDARPDFHSFHGIREPGEENRNPFDRYFRYFRWKWLISRNVYFMPSKAQAPLRIGFGETQKFWMELHPVKRGTLSFVEMCVVLPDPMGLFQRCMRVTAPEESILVMPKRYLISGIHLNGGLGHHINGDNNTNRIGESGEFVGLRDYRPGDSMRQIHWKSWAKTGKPIVKELEDTSYKRYALVLDTLSSGKFDECFEEAVSVAASFACEIDTNDCLLDLMFMKGEAHRVTAGRNLERTERLLEVLASVTPEQESSLEQLAKLVRSHKEQLTCGIVILNGWDESKKKFCRLLDEIELSYLLVAVGRDTAPKGFSGHWLEFGHIERDLMKLTSLIFT